MASIDGQHNVGVLPRKLASPTIGLTARLYDHRIFHVKPLKSMVEAAGVEPASEIAVSQECSCFARFHLGSPLALRTDKMRQKLVR